MQLDERKRLHITGVRAVESFDETSVSLDTLGGLLSVLGEGLNMARLDLDRGEAVIDGRVDAMEFTQERPGHGGFWKGLLR